jgi:hypothetical protein
MKKALLTALLACFLICLLIALAHASSSPKVLVESVRVKEGEEAEILLRLDSAPNGLAGYIINVSLENGSVAKIVSVKFPEWAKLNDSSIRETSATLEAVDLEDSIKPGATNIELATIVLKSMKRGETFINVKVVAMDDDEGNSINPFTELGKLVVEQAQQTRPPLTPFASTEVLALIVTVTVIISIGGALIAKRRSRRRYRDVTPVEPKYSR